MNIEFTTRKQERINKLVEILSSLGSSSINELAKTLGVSHMTVRRDLELLEASGRVRLFHGGVAITEDPTGSRYRLDDAEMVDHEEKLAIAEYAASLVSDGDVVFFDGGSTVELVPEFLPRGLDITVVCYTYNVMSRVLRAEHTSLIALGGRYHPSSNSFESPENIALLKRTRITKAFVSASAVQNDLGVTCSNQFEVATKRAAIESSLERYLLVDSSKFGNVHAAFFADVTDFQAIITDDRIQESELEPFTERGVDVIRRTPGS